MVIRHPETGKPLQKKNSLRTWARSTLYWFAGGFLFVTALSAVTFDRLGARARFRTMFRMLDLMESLPEPPTIVCLGSSRTGTAIDFVRFTDQVREQAAGALDSVFNAGLPLGDLTVSAKVFNEILARGVKPRVVIIEVAPEFLQRPNPWITDHIERQLTWEDSPLWMDDIVEAGQFRHWLLTRVAPLHVHRKGAWNTLGELASGKRIGVRRDGPGDDPRAERAEMRRRIQDDWDRLLGLDESATDVQTANNEMFKKISKSFECYRTGGASRETVEELIRRIQAANAKPILFTPPVRSDLRGLYTPSIESVFRAELDRFKNIHGASWIDLRAFLPDADMFDMHHIRRQASQRVTDELASRIGELLRSTGDHP